jgi:hypothetical protein
LITFYSIVRLFVLYKILFSVFLGLAWLMPRRVVGLFVCWRCQFSSSHSAALWRMISSCIMWCIWGEKNDHSFEDRKRTMVDLKAFFT